MMWWDLYNNGIQFNIVGLIILIINNNSNYYILLLLLLLLYYYYIIIIMGSDMVYCVLKNH